MPLISKSFKTELYRKAIHLSSLWMPALMIWGGKKLNIIIYSVLLIADLIIEYAAFRKTPLIGGLFRKLFIKTLRSKEISHQKFSPSGSIYVLAAALFVSVFFTPLIAAASITTMLIADTCAAIIGKSIGSVRFSNGKSIAGTMAFFISAFLVISFFFPTINPLLILLVSAGATLAEFFEKGLKIDDNLSIPLTTGLLLHLI